MTVLWSLGTAYVIYFVGTASPGPANIAIIQNALSYGRPGGVATALGVVTGSVMWGLVSAFGLGAVLSQWPDFIQIMSFFGGCYLMWLAWRALRTATNGAQHAAKNAEDSEAVPLKRLFVYGLGLHLTNPKAMFVWMSIIALGLPIDTEGLFLPLMIVAGCGLLGVFVFCSYAFVFSTSKLMAGYLRAARPINLFIAAIFGLAALSLLYRTFSL